MSLFKVFDVSASAISAQSQRLNVVASNLANAESVAGPDGKPYKARQVVFQTQMFGADPASAGVAVSQVVEDNAAPRKVHDPQNPAADTDGYVTLPNVNPVEEMVNMISASRGYQTNVDVMNTAKTLLQKVLQLGS
ncbi:flagellar component of cell-proximal portion of basal-body rod [Burkholderiales bacterium]|jgi:flagellar basal-body rod protein FlgC|nr:flagellar component of cell-proximal portion of basal-body rod [Burkholderiales bacterium]